MSPVGDNPEAAVTVLEFFDSNGPHCRRAEAMVTEMIEGVPDVRFVYQEPPTLADSSRFAAAEGITLCRGGSTSRRLPRRVWFHGRCACGGGAAA